MFARRVYLGKIRRLVGKTAIVIPHSRLKLKALFDDISLDEDGKDLKAMVAHGWTIFDKSDFHPPGRVVMNSAPKTEIGRLQTLIRKLQADVNEVHYKSLQELRETKDLVIKLQHEIKYLREKIRLLKEK